MNIAKSRTFKIGHVAKDFLDMWTVTYFEGIAKVLP